MSKISEQIREAALGPKPRHALNTHVWFGLPYGAGEHQIGRVCDAFLHCPSDEHLGYTDEAAQRTFLLLVAEALE